MSVVQSAVAVVPSLLQNGSAHAILHSTPVFGQGSSTVTEPNCVGPSCSSFSTGTSISPLSPVLGLTPVFEILAAVIGFVSTLSLIAVVIIALVANRADPDPSGRRPQSVYFFIVSFVTITVATSASALIVGSILGLTASHPTSVGHVLIRLLVISALLTAVSLVLFTLHMRRGLLFARGESAAGPSRRVGQSYVSIVAFVSIMVMLVAGVFSIYLLLSLIAPGAFGSFGGRAWTLRILIEMAYLTIVATYILWIHSSMLSPGLDILGRKSNGPSVTPYMPADQFQPSQSTQPPPPPPPPVPPLTDPPS